MQRFIFLYDMVVFNFKTTVTQNGPGSAVLDMALSHKIWINSNADGWRPELENLLKSHYGM